MSEVVSKDTLSSGWSSRFLPILILFAILTPHTLEITRVSLEDDSYTQSILVAGCWTLLQKDGSTIAGPYSSTLFLFPNELALLWTILFVPLYLCIIYTQWRLVRGITTKGKVLCVIAAALAIQLVVLMAFFSYSLDGWASGIAYPLPIFHVLSALSVFWHRRPKSTLSGGNSGSVNPNPSD
ncbi:MAG: hypothetical protein C4K48_03480 [Candidatus Thorarchaeota archaeon]|nr:MAG: hypothetical protein C4K48_03480 [Candidatus Thorarchaeota archaeon]